MKKGFLFSICLFITIAFSFQTNAQVITTVAGTGVAGYSGDDSAATLAKLKSPNSVTLDTFGNLFFADAGNHCVRKVDISVIITTIAGNGTAGFSGDDSAATNARLNSPRGVAVDNYGNVYISDYSNNRIRKVNAAGIITTIAGNGTEHCIGNGVPATDASIGGPSQIIADDSGNLYWAEFSGHVIRKLDATGIISTFAGICGSLGTPVFGAHANATVLNYPIGVAKDKYGNVYITDQFDFWVYKVDVSGIIRVYAGTGPIPGGAAIDGDSATRFFIPNPYYLGVDTTGNLYFSEGTYCKIRRVLASNDRLYTVAGNGTCGFNGDGVTPLMAKISPGGMAIARDGSIYFADGNNRVRKIGGGTPSGTESIERAPSNLIVYPNPNYGHFTINIPSINTEKAAVVIVDGLGKKISEYALLTNNDHDIALNVSPGIYFLSVETSNGKWYKKVIVTN